MSILTILVLAVSLSMDSFAVALGAGACLRRPTWWDTLRVGFCFGFVQLLMPLIGFGLGHGFASQIADIDHWVAFLLLLGVGGKMVWEALSDEEDGEDGESRTGRMPVGTLFLTAIATSIDAAAVGVSLAVIDVDIVGICLWIGVVTFVIACSGMLMGRAAGPLLGRRAELIGGIGLIAIGAKILYEHTIGF